MTATNGTRRRFWWVRWLTLALVLVILGVEAYLVWPKLKETWFHLDEIEWDWVALCILAAMSVDGQLRPGPARTAAIGGPQDQAVAVAVGGPRRELAEPDDARRPGPRTGVHLPRDPPVGRHPGGRVLAGGDVRAADGRRPGRPRPRWRAARRRPDQPVLDHLLDQRLLGLRGRGPVRRRATRTRSRASASRSCAGSTTCATRPPTTASSAGRRSCDNSRPSSSNPRKRSIAFGWSLFNWVADVACLAFACYAVGGQPSISGLMVAYAASQGRGHRHPVAPRRSRCRGRRSWCPPSPRRAWAPAKR